MGGQSKSLLLDVLGWIKPSPDTCFFCFCRPCTTQKQVGTYERVVDDGKRTINSFSYMKRAPKWVWAA